jgi:hypothetical protein
VKLLPLLHQVLMLVLMRITRIILSQRQARAAINRLSSRVPDADARVVLQIPYPKSVPRSDGASIQQINQRIQVQGLFIPYQTGQAQTTLHIQHHLHHHHHK